MKIPWNKGKSKYPELDLNQIIYCACNCGERIVLRSIHRYDGIPRFIHGHNATGKTSKDAPKAESKRKINSRLITGHRPFVKDKEYYCLCNCGVKIKIKDRHRYEGIPDYLPGHFSRINNPFKGKTHTGRVKEIISKSNYARKQIFPFINTKPERILQEALTKVGIIFEKHKSIFGQPDIFIEPNICIFVDGDYWHGNPKFYKENDIIAVDKTAKESWDKDQNITKVLIQKGYIVLRFWEHQINSNLEDCIQKTKEELQVSV